MRHTCKPVRFSANLVPARHSQEWDKIAVVLLPTIDKLGVTAPVPTPASRLRSCLASSNTHGERGATPPSQFRGHKNLVGTLVYVLDRLEIGPHPLHSREDGPRARLHRERCNPAQGEIAPTDTPGWPRARSPSDYDAAALFSYFAPPITTLPPSRRLLCGE